MIDEMDRKILHALQCAPRLPFRHIAEVTGVSEQTAARRYHALRRSGVMRVVGLVNPAVHGKAQWVTRIRSRPDRVGPLADSLAKRPDVAYANLASGGSEIICMIHSPVEAERDDIILRQLPRSASVLDVSIDLLLHPFGETGTSEWTGYGDGLTPDQVRQLTADRPPTPTGPLRPPAEEDAPLLDALAEDGRTTHTRLAELTGWSNTRVARRMEALETSGTLFYDVELLPERLGHTLNATLWLRVTPARLQQAGEQLAQHAEVAFAGAISGHHNLMVSVICRDAEDFYRYLTTSVAAVEGIDAYEVSIRVRRLKQAASLIFRGRLVHTTPA
ncbi:Lrp/AsnC family transcriptional regulator [Streptomyces sp. WI04-05B]|uniref:Lrp/AsnC family transcriptional regulator n=1 Tax=Streptomyces TaxID=1883 RepID=UPI0029AB7CC7|nr:MULTISPECIES: Lrp/AsnC family transcriptional regulator [unclassified Streptomyces]MDX2545395.1 Lrp/AsnC family transcriptional regulator [Streptomyces sp. WI04-05B]MDX2588110.1 Lrp/AsnC family transcriptional regulator [Streptomyces sp. WI04-05A]